MLRGPSVMPGYLLDDIEGEPTGLVDGWLATGDLGSVDERGLLTIVGRTKEIINRGGEKIAPYDVEKALLAHPAVREAAAFAVPHARLGENVGAAVVLHPGAGATSTELIDFAYERLAPFQRPRHVHIVDSLPVGPTGKISRPRLSAAFADARRDTPPPAAPLEILIAEIWQRLLKRADIGMDDDFFEIGGDSLQATEMLLEVEEIDASSHQPVGHPRPAHHPRAVRPAGRRGGRPGRGDDQGEGGRRHAALPLPRRFLRLGLLWLSPERDAEGQGARLSAALAARWRQGHRDDRGHGVALPRRACRPPLPRARFGSRATAMAALPRSNWCVGSRRRDGPSRRSS